MWIITGFGMFMPVLRPKELFKKGDDPAQTIQIRARRRKELDMLRKLHMPELGKTVSTPNRDYQFRAYCTPEVASAGFAKAIAEINYEHFKETTETVYHDKKLHDVCMRIWSVACDLNPPNWDAKPFTTRSKAYKLFIDLDAKRKTPDEAFTALAKLPRVQWIKYARPDEVLEIESRIPKPRKNVDLAKESA